MPSAAILVVLMIVLAVGFHRHGWYGGGWLGLVVVLVAVLYMTHRIRPGL